MSSESYLLNIPELVMNIILDKLDFKSVQTLRKVSRDLREFIDDQKPDPRIEEITVSALESGDLKFCYKNPQAEVSLCYEVRDGGKCALVYEGKERILETEENLLNRAFKDFETIFRNQNSTLKLLKLNLNHFDNVVDLLKTVLKSRSQRLKVETLVTDQVMKILPFLNPDSLLELNIFGSTDQPIRTLGVLEINELAERGPKIQELSIWDCYVPSASLQVFTRFSKCSIDVELVHLNDVLLLKKALLQSPIFQKFRLYYTTFPDIQQFFDAMGPPISEPQTSELCKTWKFPDTQLRIILVVNCEKPKILFLRQ